MSSFNFLQGLRQSAPQYTSYPMPEYWETSAQHLQSLPILETKERCSLYLHFPVGIRDTKAYREALAGEILLLSRSFLKQNPLSHLYFKIKYPNQIDLGMISYLWSHLQEAFDLSSLQQARIDIPPDPSIQADKLKELGFHHVGLVLTDPLLSPGHMEATSHALKQAQIPILSISCYYGLPGQPLISFRQRIQEMLTLMPERILLLSAPLTEEGASMEERFAMYSQARRMLVQAGYQAIGLELFSLPHDPITSSFQQQTLNRSFFGYTEPQPQTIIGVGAGAKSAIHGMFLRNLAQPEEYIERIQKQQCAISHKKSLSPDDKVRNWVIQKLFCTFSVSKRDFATQFGCSFDTYFIHSRARLLSMEHAGLIQNKECSLIVTPLGELFVRIIATAFDAYFLQEVAP